MKINLCLIQIFTPEDGPRGTKHVGNKHRLSCVDRILDYLLYKKEDNEMSALKTKR